MTGLPEALAGYLDLRRGLGFKLDRDAKLLAQFITYLEEHGTGTLTVADALTWATLPGRREPGLAIQEHPSHIATLPTPDPGDRHDFVLRANGDRDKKLHLAFLPFALGPARTKDS